MKKQYIPVVDPRFNPNIRIGSIPDQGVGIYIAKIANMYGITVLYIAKCNESLLRAANTIKSLFPGTEVLRFPEWNCGPYDYISPQRGIMSERVNTLTLLSENSTKGRVVVTTYKALMQKTVPSSFLLKNKRNIKLKDLIEIDELVSLLSSFGYVKAPIVVSVGEFAVRGGIIDFFPPGNNPIRIDFFGEEIEQLKEFSVESQCSIKNVESARLVPITEVILNPETIKRFCSEYIKTFNKPPDSTYKAVANGQYCQGIEHLLPLFYTSAGDLLDYAKGHLIFCDDPLEEATEEYYKDLGEKFSCILRMNESTDKHRKSKHLIQSANVLEPDHMVLDPQSLLEKLSQHAVHRISSHRIPEGENAYNHFGKIGKNFKTKANKDVTDNFAELVKYIKLKIKEKKLVVIASISRTSCEKIKKMLFEYDIASVYDASTWDEVEKNSSVTNICVWDLDQGFETPEIAVISERDFLKRLTKKAKKKNNNENLLFAASSLSTNDLVTHIQHGIGRYLGIKTINAGQYPHDCLLIEYRGGDKLYLPVENAELVKSFGTNENMELDKLGDPAWQMRKARAKKRIKDMAEKLLKVAAIRLTKQVSPINTNTDEFSLFCSSFPYEETPDQLTAIHDVMQDLEKTHPMNRVVCGDVGFGKTEVAMRAAFLVADSGKQVAVVVPTTLLARQHFEQFSLRFSNFHFNIAQLSRLTSSKQAQEIRKKLKEGLIDIVIGTHTILSEATKFHDLGLLIIDEEQHFGVAHKEKLKEISENLHVLTMTATPIPRTLQMAISGITEMSVILTPPARKTPVNTYVLQFDPAIIRNAILHEQARGGRSFWIVPRIGDIPESSKFIEEYLPEVSYAISHGRMPTAQLDKTISEFYEGKYDILLSTTIIESGLDIPAANTLILEQSDMFGLSQLYQIRGRVGRSAVKAFAYMTTKRGKLLSSQAERRLQVIESMDGIGSNFELARHDLDIRGGGNLLGEEQTGRIKEVGVELYNSMLEEAVSLIKLQSADDANGSLDGVLNDEDWSPQINLNVPVTIPESYISDTDLRLTVYKQLSQITSKEEINDYLFSLQDRFGKPPKEVIILVNIIQIKSECKNLGILKAEGGKNGLSLTFQENSSFTKSSTFDNFMNKYKEIITLHPGNRLTIKQSWNSGSERIKGSYRLLRNIQKLKQNA